MNNLQQNVSNTIIVVKIFVYFYDNALFMQDCYHIELP